MYHRVRGGGVALTEEARRFRENVKAIVVNNLAEVLGFPVDPEVVYELELRAYFELLENPEWFNRYTKDTFFRKDVRDKKTRKIKHRKGDIKNREGQRKAATRYKVIDADNRIKFMQDCVTKSIGVPNDCQVFKVTQSKHEDSDNPRVEVRIVVGDRADYISRRR